MKFGKTLIGALLVGILVLAPSAYGISISVYGDMGGFTENIQAGARDSVYGSAAIGPGSFSNSIRGSGNLKESHWVSNSAGSSAGVGVDIRKAESYNYGYTLTPGIGSFWKASKYPVVSAGETLDVLNANYINAYANSFNAKGEAAGVSMVLVDPGNKASLTGYSNSATASAQMVSASQNAESATAPNGQIQTDAGSQLNQWRIYPLELKMEKADASTSIKKGSINGYSDQASASNDMLDASQHIDSASGNEIKTGSKSTYNSVSIFKGLKMSSAEASTTTFGDLTGYDGKSKVSSDLVEARQSGHIEGAFTSKAVAGSASKTRSSNYGNEYDLNMQARKDASGSSASGNLGYYVDCNDRIANRIQGAVDASESGDSVNVAPGTYYENVQIDKSLTVKGSGASKTIVDGQQSGSVFTIGKNDPNVDVTLSGMTIQGGSGTDIGYWPELPLRFGGGILNYGHLHVIDSTISKNIVDYGGGGIFNAGTATITGGSLSKNTGYEGGAIYNDYGSTVTVIGSTISENAAIFGGGIQNHGTNTVIGSEISNNTALCGGGILNDWYGTTEVMDSKLSQNSANIGGGILNDGTATITGSIISKNNADYGDGGGFGGGGIANSGTLMVAHCNISENTARYGGGIYNNVGGTTVVTGSTMSKNAADFGDSSINSGWGNGGGIFNAGLTTIIDSNISQNFAYYKGGGIYNDYYYATTNLESGSIDHNIANLDGGGIYNNLGTLIGNMSIVHENIPDQIVYSVDWLPEV